MNVQQIKNLEDLLPLDGSKKIISHKVSRLTAPGDNYGSLMLSVDITVKTPHGHEEIHAVGKLVPPNEFIQKVFNTQVTFRNEIGCYKTIFPLLQIFQKEHGVQQVIDFFPKYYGSRLNLNGGDKVDEDAALVLENLKVLNYVTLDRTVGCDLDVAKLIITDLAHLHAVPLALKLQNPDLFADVIMPFMTRWKAEGLDQFRTQLNNLIDETDALKTLKERILAGFDKQLVPNEPREPFATIAHNDCWVGNTLIKFDGKEAVKSKLVDYQVCSYESPAKDIVFFLFSSVKNHVIEKHYDELLKLYYQTFISVLKELRCDTTEFTFETLEQEIDFEATNTQFGHIAFMLFPIFADKDKVKEISEFTPESMLTQEVSDALREKYVFVVNEFAKRNWI